MRVSLPVAIVLAWVATSPRSEAREPTLEALITAHQFAKDPAAQGEHVEGRIVQIQSPMNPERWEAFSGAFVYDRAGERRKLVWTTDDWELTYLDDAEQGALLRVPGAGRSGAETTLLVLPTAGGAMVPFEHLLRIPYYAIAERTARVLGARESELQGLPGAPSGPAACRLTAGVPSQGDAALSVVGCRLGPGFEAELWFDAASRLLCGWKLNGETVMVYGGSPPSRGEVRWEDGRAMQVLIERRSANPASIRAIPTAKELVEELAKRGVHPSKGPRAGAR